MVNKLLLMKKPGLIPGAIAYWDCTQVVGQVLPDLSGNGNHGQLGSTAGADTNDPTATAQGLLFGGDDGALVPTVPYSTTEITVMIVCSGPTQADGVVGGKYDAAVNKRCWWVSLTANASTFAASVSDNGTFTGHIREIRSSVGVFGDGKYHCIGFTFRNGAMSLICDGVIDPSPTVTFNNNPLTIYNPVCPTSLGCRLSNGAIASGFSGTIVAFLVVPLALSSAQIAQNHAYFRAKFAPLGVVLP